MKEKLNFQNLKFDKLIAIQRYWIVKVQLASYFANRNGLL